jgi:WD40 repeat protein
MSATRNFLKGHRDSVVSLDSDPDGALIVSSSDDFSVRLWDVRQKSTAIRLFKIPFHGDMGICRISGNLLTASSGPSVFGFDMRTSQSVIVSKADFEYHGISDDDINDYDVGERSILLPTDSGAIKEISVSTFTDRCTSNVHENIASVVRILPSSTQTVSGGYDCRLITGKLTDVGIEPIKNCSVQTLIPLDEDSEPSSSQIVNPPFVTGLEVSPSKENMAMCLGDGSVVVLDIRKKGVDMRRPVWGGANIHASSVSGISWSRDSRSIWSVGTDSVLVKMNEHCISIRYALEGYKPNSVVELGPNRVAIAGTLNDIELIDFR